MNIYVMDDNFTVLGVCDTYQSIIWTPRYYDIGDFELYLPCTSEHFKLFQAGRYLVRDIDVSGTRYDNVMIVERVETSTSEDDGDYLIVTGRDLKSIFTRRVIWPQMDFGTAKVSDIIYKMLVNLTASDAAIEPYASRRIPNMTIDKTYKISDTIDKQYTGDVLSDAVIELLKAYHVGWRVYVQSKKYVVQLYAGTDRSYDQTENPFVVFSEDFDDLITSNYAVDATDYKNFIYVAGEGEGTSRIYASADDGTEVTGLHRREAFADARNVTSDNGVIPDDTYKAMLKEEGVVDLTGYVVDESISGELDFTTTYALNEDVFLGDQVQLVTPYGCEAKVRITEIIESEDASGSKVQATFEYE